MVNKEVENFKRELNEFCYKNANSNLVYFDDQIISNISFSETYRSLLNYNFSNLVLRNMFISYLEQIYKFSPATISFIPYFISLENIEEITLPFENELAKLVSEPDYDSIEKIIRFFFSDSSLFKEGDFIKMFKENGFLSRFDVQKSNSIYNACEFSNGYHISCTIPQIYFDSIKKDQKDISNSYIIFYDGYIESVSEINSILTDSYNNKNRYLLFCRGSHPDVERTSAVNLGLNKATLILAYPNDDFWHDTNLKKLTYNTNASVFGYRTGLLLNNCLENKSKHIDLFFNSRGITFKGEEFEMNKDAITKIYLNKSNWMKKGIIEDQLNYFSSLLQQISLCGLVEDIHLEELGIDVEKVFKKRLKKLPAFPVFRALKESKYILEKISSVGFIVKR